MLNADDPDCQQAATRTKSQVFWFSRRSPVERARISMMAMLLFRMGKGETPEIDFAAV